LKNDADGQVGDVLEGLIEKIEKISREKSEEIEKSRIAFASMNRLTEALSRLEYQKKRENQVAKKVTQMYQKLETRSAGKNKKIELKDLNDYFTKFLNGAKVTGQVIEVVAGSMQMMMQTVAGVVKNQNTVPRSESEPEGAGEAGSNLAALLKPFSTLINSLVTKQQSPADKSEEIKTEEKKVNPFSGEDSAIPMTKAIPSGHHNYQEIM